MKAARDVRLPWSLGESQIDIYTRPSLEGIEEGWE
jgi:hypothetical protein